MDLESTVKTLMAEVIALQTEIASLKGHKEWRFRFKSNRPEDITPGGRTNVAVGRLLARDARKPMRSRVRMSPRTLASGLATSGSMVSGSSPIQRSYARASPSTRSAPRTWLSQWRWRTKCPPTSTGRASPRVVVVATPTPKPNRCNRVMWTARQAAELRSHATALRHRLEPYDAWPRDARAWARRDRIEALLSRMETELVGATASDHRAVRELQEWVAHEFAFVRAYPVGAIPAHWTGRPLSPHELRRRRMWRDSVGEAIGESA